MMKVLAALIALAVSGCAGNGIVLEAQYEPTPETSITIRTAK